MGKGMSKSVAEHELEPVSLSELIHRQVRVAIETAVHEELRTALRAVPYERSDTEKVRNAVNADTAPKRPDEEQLPEPGHRHGAAEVRMDRAGVRSADEAPNSIVDNETTGSLPALPLEQPSTDRGKCWRSSTHGRSATTARLVNGTVR